MWLQMAAIAFQMAYGPAAAIEIEVKEGFLGHPDPRPEAVPRTVRVASNDRPGGLAGSVLWRFVNPARTMNGLPSRF